MAPKVKGVGRAPLCVARPGGVEGCLDASFPGLRQEAARMGRDAFVEAQMRSPEVSFLDARRFGEAAACVRSLLDVQGGAFSAEDPAELIADAERIFLRMKHGYAKAIGLLDLMEVHAARGDREAFLRLLLELDDIRLHRPLEMSHVRYRLAAMEAKFLFWEGAASAAEGAPCADFRAAALIEVAAAHAASVPPGRSPESSSLKRQSLLLLWKAARPFAPGALRRD